MLTPGQLNSHSPRNAGLDPGPIVVVGEVIWDVFSGSARLGGAPLNFAVHATRMGRQPILISALGRDEMGDRAAQEIEVLGLPLGMVSRSSSHPTGAAVVSIDGRGNATYRIARPAAYDDIALAPKKLEELRNLRPGWLYYGTLFASRDSGRAVLLQLLNALPDAWRFYDVNLRADFQSMEVVAELLAAANVVKLNEAEARAIADRFSLPSPLADFCREGAARFGWRASAVTLGERGCVVWNGGDCACDKGHSVQVADTVGAGDAFSAAFLHGLVEQWPAARIANFANRVGALVASRPGAIPEWSLAEAAAL
jgi:fructokinase